MPWNEKKVCPDCGWEQSYDKNQMPTVRDMTAAFKYCPMCKAELVTKPFSTNR